MKNTAVTWHIETEDGEILPSAVSIVELPDGITINFPSFGCVPGHRYRIAGVTYRAVAVQDEAADEKS